MAYVADSLGVQVVTIPQLHREISPVQRPARDDPPRRDDAGRAPDDPAHAHRESRCGRPCGCAARRPRAPTDRRAHVPRPRAARLLRPVLDVRLPDARADASPTSPTRSSPSARRCGTNSSRSASRRPRSSRSSGSGSSSRAASPERAEARAETRRVMGVRDDRFLVGWTGRMTGVKRTDDRPARVRAPPQSRRARDAVHGRRRARPPPDRGARVRARDRPRLPLHRLPGGRRPVLRRVRRLRAPLGQRGHAGDARSRRWRAAARLSPLASAACRTSSRTARTGSCRPRLAGAARRRARPPRRATRSFARAWARRGAADAAALRGQPPVDDVDTLYRELLARKRLWERASSRRQRAGTRCTPASCAVGGHQPGLPAGEVRLVADEEPEHQVDPRVACLRDRERLRQVARLVATTRRRRPGRGVSSGSRTR